MAMNAGTVGFFAPHPAYCTTPEEGTHLDEFRRDPSFPMLSGEQLRRLVAAPAPAIYVLSPPRMYDLLRAEAGPGLRPDPIYEDVGGGLFAK